MGTQIRKFTLKMGDTVLYNKFGLGATDVEVEVRRLYLPTHITPLTSALQCLHSILELLCRVPHLTFAMQCVRFALCHRDSNTALCHLVPSASHRFCHVDHKLLLRT